MSLILEALRKSEAERRRGEMPDLRAELPPPASPRRAPLSRAWPWLVAIVAVGIVAALLLHPWSRNDTTTAAADTTATPTESIRMESRPQPAAAPRIETPRIAEREAPKPQPSPQPAMPAPPPAVAETAPEPVPEPAPAATTDSQETSINALPAELRKALPPLQLSMHMWDADPARRFVILDGERHVEGDSVGPMRIRRIDADGVLFDWQGRAVRLPLR